MNYTIPEDIVNRGLQHIGAPRIVSLTDNSKNAAEATFLYDKCRRAELRANLWNFAARRLVLRPYQPGTTQIWVPPVWSTSIGYILGSIITYNGVNWISHNSSNTGILPGLTVPFLAWNEFFQPIFFNPYLPGTVYYTGEIVSFGLAPDVWIALATIPTTANPPPTNVNWLKVTTTISTLSLFTVPIFVPQGITTNTLSTPKPAYPLPNGYVRVMPQDPKSAATPAQLSTAGMQNSDYEFEGGFLYTNSTKGGPLVFRFAADVRNVYWFEDLFSEAVACRIALELCEPLTQSAQKRQQIHGFYEEYLEKAQRVNAIEAGSTEPDTADVKTNRRPAIEKLPPPQRQQG